MPRYLADYVLRAMQIYFMCLGTITTYGGGLEVD